MIGRFAILWRKEAAQHAGSLLAMGALLSLIALLRWLLARLDAMAVSELQGASVLISVFVPVAAAVLGHKVVVREYQAKSQLFLEALPIRRWEMVLAKFSFGLFALSTSALLSLFAFALAASDATPRFLLASSLRTIGFVTACWSVFFAMGMLGRLRAVAYLTLGLGVFAIHALTRFELARFGPFALIDAVAFTYDRTDLPWRAVAESLGLSLGFLGLGLGVALIREGSLAEVLARRAASREVAALLVLAFAEVVAFGWIASAQKQPPFEFTSSSVVRSHAGTTAVMYAFPELEPRAVEVLRAFERLDRHLRSPRALGQPIDVRVAHNGLLEARELRDQSRYGEERLLLEVNLGEKGFDPTLLLQRALHASFMRLTGGRAAFEPNHWLLDGAATHAAIGVVGTGSQREWARALVALRRHEPSVQAVLHWEQTMQRVGEAHANAVGFSLIDFLIRRHGEQASLTFSRSMLTERTVDGLFSWLSSRDPTFSARFGELMGESFSDFCRAWRAELPRRAADPELAAILQRTPFDRATLRLRAGRAGSDLSYAASGPILERARDCVLLHGVLRPYDVYYPEPELRRHPVRWPAGEARLEGALRGRYSPGQRVFAAFDCEVPELASLERLAVERLGGP